MGRRIKRESKDAMWVCVYVAVYVGVCVCKTLQPHGQHPIRLLGPWGSLGKDTGVGGHFLLQGIFPTQGSNLGVQEWPEGWAGYR